ncbi:MAG: threonine synthase [Selenomonas sp.]|uniref:threonine synthase n=1 Tax=Selenomonas sp. TaxID=2053611 RepID=UPI0025D50BFD|nr:threonine synthase [Selenomonas sp.]MCR5756829.1 threonine synthase [Selenomonas sp.]
MEFVCNKCGHREEITTKKVKCDCGGLWKLDYQPPKYSPELIDEHTWSLFRYRKFMPLPGEEWRQVTLGEGMTPVISFDEHTLFKMDYYMPTLSFKDRGAAVLVAYMKAMGIKKAVQDSSGNAGNSVAAYCGRVGIQCEIFVPEGTSDKKIRMIEAHGAKAVVVPGNRDHCADVCREKVAKEGVFYANHVYNPFFYEGTKTYIYETFEQLGHIPEHIFVPLGNGTLFIGIMKALEELLASGVVDHMPQVVIVQSEVCQPFVKAMEAGRKDVAIEAVQRTLAEGIAIGVPMRSGEILEYIYKYKVQGVTIPEEGILPAREKIARQGIYCEHTTAAVYAGYERYCQQYGKPREALLSMCGAGLKSDHA